jgi:hypothetical protein
LNIKIIVLFTVNYLQPSTWWKSNPNLFAGQTGIPGQGAGKGGGGGGSIRQENVSPLLRSSGKISSSCLAS